MRSQEEVQRYLDILRKESYNPKYRAAVVALEWVLVEASFPVEQVKYDEYEFID